MAQCPNGSQPASGAPATFWAYDLPFLSYLEAKIPALAAFLSAYSPNELIVTAEFCAVEPPTPSPPTLQDYVNAVQDPPTFVGTLLTYWKANYLASIWPTYCQCKAGGAPSGTLEAYLVSLGVSALWPFDDSTGIAAYRDLSGNGYRALQNGGTLNTPKFLPNAASNCVTLAADGYSLNGSLMQTLGISAGKWAFGGFVKTSDTGGTNPLLMSTYDGANAAAINVYNLGGNIGFFIRNSAGTSTGDQTGPTIHDNQPHFWLVQYDATAHIFEGWLDGTRFASGALPTGTLSSPGGQIHHFSQSGGGVVQGYTGLAADFFILHDNLGATQQQLLMFEAGLASFPPFVPPATTTPAGLPAAGPAGFTCTTIGDVCTALYELNAKVDSLTLSNVFQNTSSIAFGTPVTGVANSGSLDATGFIGLEVTCTTIPAGWGHTTDVPNRYIPQLGSIQLDFASAGPYGDSYQLHYTPQIFLFDQRAVKRINYSLRPGVRATLTPVTRGP